MQQKPDLMHNNFKGRDILSLDQFDRQSVEKIFTITKKLKQDFQQGNLKELLTGALITLLFYEPSSRTFGSFSAAAKRLGAQTLDIQNPMQVSSVAKGESLPDTIRTFANYSDAIILRHPEAGTAQLAADVSPVPVINAGDGVGEHPTQALLDMFTLYEKFGTLDSITGLIAGDLKNGRTVHSLIRGLSLFPDVTLYLLSPESLSLAKADMEEMLSRGIKLVEITSEKDIPKNARFWYWTRVQKERFDDGAEYERVKDSFVVTQELLDTYGTQDMILMHPLPRVGEIAETVDSDPRAVYLTTEMQNGMFVRMAILALVLGKIT